jgi:hypothetical protein
VTARSRTILAGAVLGLGLVSGTGLGQGPAAASAATPAPVPPTPAPPAAAPAKKLTVTGDLRLRIEEDWDSRTAAGVPRADRTRLRARARIFAEAKPRPGLSLGLRLRTGPAASQQSAHITLDDFDDNPNGDRDVLVDRWYLQAKGARGWAWAGRNGFPFWKQNELFWDDDVTPAGVAAGFERTHGSSKIAVTAGGFALPDGGRNFHGRLTAGQVVATTRRGTTDLVAAAGLYRLDGEPGARFLRNGNGGRDYLLEVVSLQLRRPLGGRPLTLGLDLIRNAESYRADDPDPFTARHRDETDGLVAGVAYGQLQQRGNWLVGYTWARVETLAVAASYAQDDFIRWGTADQTDSSDFTGHELRLGWVLRKNLDLQTRFYAAEALTSVQDGKRFRLDLNYRF